MGWFTKKKPLLPCKIDINGKTFKVTHEVYHAFTSMHNRVLFVEKENEKIIKQRNECNTIVMDLEAELAEYEIKLNYDIDNDTTRKETANDSKITRNSSRRKDN